MATRKKMSTLKKLKKSLKSLAGSIKPNAIKFLQFMRLVGDDGHWDWTTASLVVTLAVLLKVQDPGVGEIAALALTLLARGHKKYLGSKVTNSVAAQLDDMRSEVAKVLTAAKSEAAAAVKESASKAEVAVAALTDIKTRLGFDDINPWNKR